MVEGFLVLALALAQPSSPYHRPYEPGPSTTEPPISESDCALLSGDKYWFCTSLEQSRPGAAACGLNRTSDAFWFCQAIVDRNCGVVRAGWDFCTALIERDCTRLRGAEFKRCAGWTENCAYVEDADRDECLALRRFFRVRQEPERPEPAVPDRLIL